MNSHPKSSEVPTGFEELQMLSLEIGRLYEQYQNKLKYVVK